MDRTNQTSRSALRPQWGERPIGCDFFQCIRRLPLQSWFAYSGMRRRDGCFYVYLTSTTSMPLPTYLKFWSYRLPDSPSASDSLMIWSFLWPQVLRNFTILHLYCLLLPTLVLMGHYFITYNTRPPQRMPLSSHLNQTKYVDGWLWLTREKASAFICMYHRIKNDCIDSYVLIGPNPCQKLFDTYHKRKLVVTTFALFRIKTCGIPTWKKMDCSSHPSLDSTLSFLTISWNHSSSSARITTADSLR